VIGEAQHAVPLPPEFLSLLLPVLILGYQFFLWEMTNPVGVVYELLQFFD
jgi:hypothetical protein